MLRWILNRFDLYSEERYIRESRVRKSVYFPDQVGLHKANLGEHGPRPHAIILVHGFASKHWIWDDLISCAKQDTASSDFDFYSFEYDAFWESPINLDDAALTLALQIERVRDLNHHQNIILIGHSIGGLVARAAVLYGRGARGAVKYRWAEENCLRRIVLIASLNRGTRYFEQHRFQRFLAGVKYKPKGRPFFLEQFLHGSPFVTNLRLDWIVEFSGSKNAPEVVQVYGEADGSHKGDRWVTRDDSEDLLSLPNTTQIPSMGRGHRTIMIMKDIEDPAYLTVRSAVFDAFEHIGAPGKRPNDQNSDAASGNTAVQSKASGQLTDVVFVVHGIRTYADWIQPLTAKLTAKRPNCRVVDAGYGYFSTLNFLLPWSRQKKMGEFTDKYMVNLANHPSLPRYAVAHSFGTYVVARSLAEHPKMSFEKIYFAGSVLPREFPWYTGDGRLGIIPHRLKWLRNDRSVNDWPVGFLCSALHSLGHNQLGTGGFRGFVHAENDSMVQLKEYFPGGHSAPLDNQENLETICEYLFTTVPKAMAKVQPKPLSRTERLLNWSSEKAAVIAVAIVASLLMVGPALTWHFTGSWFLALLAFAIVVLFVFWFLNSF